MDIDHRTSRRRFLAGMVASAALPGELFAGSGSDEGMVARIRKVLELDGDPIKEGSPRAYDYLVTESYLARVARDSDSREAARRAGRLSDMLAEARKFRKGDSSAGERIGALSREGLHPNDQDFFGSFQQLFDGESLRQRGDREELANSTANGLSVAGSFGGLIHPGVGVGLSVGATLLEPASNLLPKVNYDFLKALQSSPSGQRDLDTQVAQAEKMIAYHAAQLFRSDPKVAAEVREQMTGDAPITLDLGLLATDGSTSELIQSLPEEERAQIERGTGGLESSNSPGDELSEEQIAQLQEIMKEGVRAAIEEARREEAVKEKDARELQQLHRDIDSGIDIAGFIIGDIFGDRRAAEIFTTTLGAVHKTAQIIDNLAEIGVMGAISGGLSLFSSVFSLFGGPSADELILEGIGDIKKMLGELSQQIQDGFEHLSGKIDRLAEFNAARFEDVILNQRQILTELCRIGEELSEGQDDIQAQVETLTGQVAELADLVIREDHHDELTEFQEQIGLLSELAGLVSVKDVDVLKAMVKIENHAVRTSGSPTFSGRDIGGTSFAAVMEQLSRRPSIANTFGADRVVAGRFGVSLPAGGGRNPVEWARGAQAFLEAYDLFVPPGHTRLDDNLNKVWLAGVEIHRNDRVMGGEQLFRRATERVRESLELIDIVLAEEAERFIGELLKRCPDLRIDITAPRELALRHYRPGNKGNYRFDPNVRMESGFFVEYTPHPGSSSDLPDRRSYKAEIGDVIDEARRLGVIETAPGRDGRPTRREQIHPTGNHEVVDISHRLRFLRGKRKGKELSGVRDDGLRTMEYTADYDRVKNIRYLPAIPSNHELYDDIRWAGNTFGTRVLRGTNTLPLLRLVEYDLHEEIRRQMYDHFENLGTRFFEHRPSYSSAARDQLDEFSGDLAAIGYLMCRQESQRGVLDISTSSFQSQCSPQKALTRFLNAVGRAYVEDQQALIAADRKAGIFYYTDDQGTVTRRTAQRDGPETRVTPLADSLKSFAKGRLRQQLDAVEEVRGDAPQGGVPLVDNTLLKIAAYAQRRGIDLTL
ncbi:hypothetical protein MRY87_09455 [bacterium]|nr:hypothetical protein [bacterium]